MKKILFLLIVLLVSSTTYTSGQILKDLKKKAKEVIPSGSSLSAEEVGRGLKEALNKGIKKGVATVSEPDGYFKDPIIKILMPKEAKSVASKLRGIGQGKLVDEAIESMNRAAEDAAKGALNIFVDAIKAMTIKDAMNILKGEDDAATQYLSKSTRTQLTVKFLPVIKVSLDKVGATKNWKSLMSAYNKIPFVKKVNPNLEEYVTDKAIAGLFVQVAKEEKEIRDNPGARTTELLKKVFSN